MTEQPTTTPAVGDQVVVLYGAPSEMTWDDSGANDIGEKGVLVEVLGPGWLAPFVVTAADGRTIYASKIRPA